jgi:hypothetical protein
MVQPSFPNAQDDRRRCERRNVFRDGVITLDGFQKVRVAIKNVSASGVRADFFSNVSLPEFVFVVEPSLKLDCHARVVWQDGGAVGLSLLNAA